MAGRSRHAVPRRDRWSIAVLLAELASVVRRQATIAPSATEGLPKRLVRYLASAEPRAVSATTAAGCHDLRSVSSCADARLGWQAEASVSRRFGKW